MEEKAAAEARRLEAEKKAIADAEFAERAKVVGSQAWFEKVCAVSM